MSTFKIAPVCYDANCAQLRAFAELLTWAPQYRPVFSALQGGGFAFCFAGQDYAPDIENLRVVSYPTVVVIDDGGRSGKGPEGCPRARDLANWVVEARIVTRSPTQQTYKNAKMLARGAKRVALVWTSKRHADSWSELFRNAASGRTQ
jgi:hypothetical protein